jgi:hypothetical protein
LRAGLKCGRAPDLARVARRYAARVESSARITVSRQDPGDIGYRQVFARVDEGEAAILRHGDETSFEIAPGPHLLRIHNTLIWKKIELDLKPGEHARFRVVNRAGFGTYFLAGTLGVGPIYLTVQRLDVANAST